MLYNIGTLTPTDLVVIAFKILSVIAGGFFLKEIFLKCVVNLLNNRGLVWGGLALLFSMNAFLINQPQSMFVYLALVVIFGTLTMFLTQGKMFRYLLPLNLNGNLKDKIVKFIMITIRILLAMYIIYGSIFVLNISM